VSALVGKVGRMPLGCVRGICRGSFEQPGQIPSRTRFLAGPSAALPGVDQLVSNQYWPVGNVHPDSFCTPALVAAQATSMPNRPPAAQNLHPNHLLTSYYSMNSISNALQREVVISKSL